MQRFIVQFERAEKQLQGGGKLFNFNFQRCPHRYEFQFTLRRERGKEIKLHVKQEC